MKFAKLALAGALGIYTVGEGIETDEQREVLVGLGCQYGQGYLLGRPALKTVTSASSGLIR